MPASAPTSEFSAERAFRHVEALGQSPRPVGAAAHSAARAYLISQLRALGLEPSVQEAEVVQRRGPTRFDVFRIRNVLARIPGEDPTGAVLLLSHYDSRPNTAGAGDALSAVASVLETLRALNEEPALANDVIVLFSDAEEIGLVGAQAFVDQHPWAADVSLVLNFEARGNRGPAPMFETREGNLEVVRHFADAAPYPYASSMTYEVYRRMPNDTDFSVFRRAGIQGLNMAFIGKLAAYHTRLDSPRELDQGSLQHQGSYALSLTRHFGRADLSEIGATEADAVYFNPVPWKLIVYPAGFALPLALLAAALLILGSVFLVRRSGLSLRRALNGALLVVAAVISGGLAGWSVWWFIETYLPKLQAGPYGLPYEVATLTIAVLLLVLAAVSAWGAWFRCSALELSLGVWLTWGAANICLAVAIPGMSYLLTWPALIAGIVLVALAWAGERPRQTWAAALGLIAAPAALLFAPTIWMLVQALTLRQAGAAGAAVALALTPIAASLGRLHRATGSGLSWGLAVLGAAVVLWTGTQTETSARQPAVDTLVYGADSESGEAWWGSFDPEIDEWTGRLLTAGTEASDAPAVFAAPGAQMLLAPAPPTSLSAPTASVLDESRLTGRKVVARARSTRGAPVLRLFAEASVPFRSVSIAGETFDYPGDDDTEGLGEAWIHAFGHGEEGIEFTVHLDGDRPWPVDLSVVDQSWSLEQAPQRPEPRPEHLIPSHMWRTDAVYVRSSALL